MIQAKCLGKIRDRNNRIIRYRIIDKNNNEALVESDKLKEAIRSCQIDIVNLTLTSDNRLVDKKPATVLKPTITSSSKPTINIEVVIAKARAIGYNVLTFDTACKHRCYLASSPSNLDHLLIIPDDVEYIYNPSSDTYDLSNKPIQMIEGDLKVIGGRGLTSANDMFARCKVHSIDLSSFNTSKVTDMGCMFAGCKAHSIDLSSFDTSEVTYMNGMFWECKAQSLDLSSFNTSEVTDMSSMFDRCEAQFLDLSSFNTSKVTYMDGIFRDCKAQSLNLSYFNTSEVTNMYEMFMHCKAQSIDLHSFNTSKVTRMAYMFCDCEAQSIDLSSFNTSEVTDMRSMFRNCKAQSLDLSTFNTSRVTDMEKIFNGCEAQIKVNDNRLKDQLQLDSRRQSS